MRKGVYTVLGVCICLLLCNVYVKAGSGYVSGTYEQVTATGAALVTVVGKPFSSKCDVTYTGYLSGSGAQNVTLEVECMYFDGSGLHPFNTLQVWAGENGSVGTNQQTKTVNLSYAKAQFHTDRKDAFNAYIYYSTTASE